jgi:hypothetical protein
MALLDRTNKVVYAFIWNSAATSTFGTSVQVASISGSGTPVELTGESIAVVAYETSSGVAMAFGSDSPNSMKYVRYSSGAWGTVGGTIGSNPAGDKEHR